MKMNSLHVAVFGFLLWGCGEISRSRTGGIVDNGDKPRSRDDNSESQAGSSDEEYSQGAGSANSSTVAMNEFTILSESYVVALEANMERVPPVDSVETADSFIGNSLYIKFTLLKTPVCETANHFKAEETEIWHCSETLLHVKKGPFAPLSIEHNFNRSQIDAVISSMRPLKESEQH